MLDETFCALTACVLFLFHFFSRLTETVLGAEQDSVWLRDKELGQSEEVDFAVADLEMTPPQVPMPTPPSGQSGEEEGRTTDRRSPCEEVRNRWSHLFTGVLRSTET